MKQASDSFCISSYAPAPTLQAEAMRRRQILGHFSLRLQKILGLSGKPGASCEKALRAAGNAFCTALHCAFGVNSRLWVYDEGRKEYMAVHASLEYPPEAFFSLQSKWEYGQQRELQKCALGRTVYFYRDVGESYIAGNEIEREFLHFSHVAMMPLFYRASPLGVLALDYGGDGSKSLEALLSCHPQDATWHKGAELRQFTGLFNRALSGLADAMRASGEKRKLEAFAQHVRYMAGRLHQAIRLAERHLDAGDFAGCRRDFAAMEEIINGISGSDGASWQDGKEKLNINRAIAEGWKIAVSEGLVHPSKAPLLMHGGTTLNFMADMEKTAGALAHVLAAAASYNGRQVNVFSVVSKRNGTMMWTVCFNSPKASIAQFPEHHAIDNDPLEQPRAYFEKMGAALSRELNEDGSHAIYLGFPLTLNSRQ